MKVSDSAVVNGQEKLGIVVIEEIYDGVAYVRLTNGVEMDFALDRLREPPTAAEMAAKKSPITDHWIKENIDTTVLGHMRGLQMRQAVNDRTLMTWDNMSNEQKVTYIANYYQDAHYDCMALYADLSDGKVSKEHLSAHILYKLQSE